MSLVPELNLLLQRPQIPAPFDVSYQLQIVGFVRGCCHHRDELYDILEKEEELTDLVTVWGVGRECG